MASATLLFHAALVAAALLAAAALASANFLFHEALAAAYLEDEVVPVFVAAVVFELLDVVFLYLLKNDENETFFRAAAAFSAIRFLYSAAFFLCSAKRFLYASYAEDFFVDVLAVFVAVFDAAVFDADDVHPDPC